MRTATKSSAREFALEIDQLTRRITALEQSNNLLQQTVARVTAERDRALGELRLIKGSRSWKATRLLRQMNALRRLPPRQIAHVVLRKASSILRRRSAQPQFVRNSCLIVTPPHTLHLANLYASELRAVGFRATVADRLDEQFGHEHLFVFCANVFEDIRPGAVMIQMEQSTNSRWFDESYFSKLASADAIIDYSATNISFLRSHSEPFWKLFLIPVGTSEPPDNAPSFQDRDIDVFFYGDDNCPRRKRVLEALSKEFDIEIANDLYGEKLWAKLRRSKVVLNIHYYENALLETTRISECLSTGTPVVSEASIDKEVMDQFASAVSFAAPGDVGALAQAIRRLLNKQDWNAALQAGERVCRTRRVEFRRQFRRFAYARRMIGTGDLEESVFLMEFQERTMPKIYLTLSETPERESAFLQWPQASKFQRFDGLRHQKGWMGCALSYRTIMRMALQQHLDRILVCEDDVFFPDDFAERNNLVERYLADHDGEWDLFSGLIADVSPRTRISRVDEISGTKFIWIDRFVSSVYNIYARHSIDALAEWDEKNDDPYTNTIDRYLEESGRLRVVVAYPFLVGHSEDLSSTLWGFQNTQYQEFLERSAQTMNTLLEEYYKRQHAGQ